VRIDEPILDYIQDIVAATRRHDGIEVGVSPRGALALTRAVRAAAVFDAAPRTTSRALAFDAPHAAAASTIATVHPMTLVRMVVPPKVSA